MVQGLLPSNLKFSYVFLCFIVGVDCVVSGLMDLIHQNVETGTDQAK